jgi:hypothetical protein
MAVIAPPLPPVAAPPLPMRRFTVDEYHRMIDLGIIRAGEPCELLEGWIVEKMSRNPPHDLVLGLVEDEIGRLLPAGWFRRDQSAVTTSDSEPEPDVAAVRGNRRDFAERHPSAQDTGLVVEVSDTSLDFDRTEKQRTYARASIPIYWIVNIPEEQVEVYTDPTGPCDDPVYRTRRDYHRDEEVPLVLDGVEVARIPVRNLLP